MVAVSTTMFVMTVAIAVTLGVCLPAAPAPMPMVVMVVGSAMRTAVLAPVIDLMIVTAVLPVKLAPTVIATAGIVKTAAPAVAGRISALSIPSVGITSVKPGARFTAMGTATAAKKLVCFGMITRLVFRTSATTFSVLAILGIVPGPMDNAVLGAANLLTAARMMAAAAIAMIATIPMIIR